MGTINEKGLKHEILNFHDDHFKNDIVRNNKLLKKIRHCFSYLEKYIPMNVVDDTFSLDNLNVYKGKNYDWFYLKQNNIVLLVRQYRQNYTFFCINKHPDILYHSRLTTFMIGLDDDKLPDEISDNYYSDWFLILKPLINPLFELIENNEIETIWNNYSFERPDFVKINLIQHSEHTNSLDKLIFACDEIFGMYEQFFAENEVFNKLPEIKVGDKFGVYEITEVNTEIDSNNYFYNAGLTYINTNFPNSNPKWSDVYSITRYNLETFFPELLKD